MQVTRHLFCHSPSLGHLLCALLSCEFLCVKQISTFVGSYTILNSMPHLIPTLKKLIQLAADEEELLPSLFKRINLTAGEYFVREGEICRYVGFIEEGLVRYFTNQDGIEKTLYFNKEGEFVSNYQSFLPQ